MIYLFKEYIVLFLTLEVELDVTFEIRLDWRVVCNSYLFLRVEVLTFTGISKKL